MSATLITAVDYRKKLATDTREFQIRLDVFPQPGVLHFLNDIVHGYLRYSIISVVTAIHA